MELLVRIVDKKPSTDPDYEQVSRRGDIICVQPDGWAWSTAEKTNPDWWIIKVTSLLNTDRDTFLEGGRARSFEPRYRRRYTMGLTGLSNGQTILRAALLLRMSLKAGLS